MSHRNLLRETILCELFCSTVSPAASVAVAVVAVWQGREVSPPVSFWGFARTCRHVLIILAMHALPVVRLAPQEPPHDDNRTDAACIQRLPAGTTSP